MIIIEGVKGQRIVVETWMSLGVCVSQIGDEGAMQTRRGRWSMNTPRLFGITFINQLKFEVNCGLNVLQIININALPGINQ